MDAAFTSTGGPHDYLGGETPHERLTGKPSNIERLRASGSDYHVHSRSKKCGVGSKFHPYAKWRIPVEHDYCDSSIWLVSLTQGKKLVKSTDTTFEAEGKMLDLVREMEEANLAY